jgi:hypothetical protein
MLFRKFFENPFHLTNFYNLCFGIQLWNFLIWIALRILRYQGKACSRWIRCPDGANWCKKYIKKSHGTLPLLGGVDKSISTDIKSSLTAKLVLEDKIKTWRTLILSCPAPHALLSPCGEPAISHDSHHVSLVQWTNLFASRHKGHRFKSPGGTYVEPGFSC